jgi:hypothetical protein
VTAVTSLTWRCERISATEYATYRGRVDEMARLLDDELVLAPKPAKRSPSPRNAGERAGVRAMPLTRLEECVREVVKAPHPHPLPGVGGC